MRQEVRRKRQEVRRKRQEARGKASVEGRGPCVFVPFVALCTTGDSPFKGERVWRGPVLV